MAVRRYAGLHRDVAPLEPVVSTVRAVAGEPEQILAAVRGVVTAGGIYVDGGALIRQFLAAGLIDDLTVP